MGPDSRPAAAGDRDGCDCKVGRVAERYGLPELDSRLVERWRGDGTERHSLRQLEADVNRQLLRAAMRRTGADPLPGEVANVYRLLVDDEVSAGVRVEARRRLEFRGLAVDDVLDDFVSHQTVHAHLTGCLGVSHGTDSPDGDPVESAVGTVAALRSRLEAVGSSTLRTLVDGGDLDLDGFETFVDVTVVCDECGRSDGFEALVERGGCECRTED